MRTYSIVFLHNSYLHSLFCSVADTDKCESESVVVSVRRFQNSETDECEIGTTL